MHSTQEVLVLTGIGSNDASDPLARATALLVSPTSRLRNRLAPPLLRRGTRVLHAESAETALYVLMQHAVDLVVAPTELPGLDAVALAAALRDRGGPPLVVVHRPDEAHMRATWFDQGIAGCVLESEPAEQLAARCAGVVRRALAPQQGEAPWTKS